MFLPPLGGEGLGFGDLGAGHSWFNRIQSNGAEMMRLACCGGTEAGLKICAPIHDALLLEAPSDQIDDHILQLTGIMQRASELALGDGRTCGIDVDVVHYPGRYSDERGKVMWDRVMSLLPGVNDVLAV